MNKKKRDKQELYDQYSSMSHRELVKECVRMGSRLNTLSDICDTEDVYNVYYEQQKAQRDLTMMKRHLDKWITNHPQYNYEAELRNGMEIHITLQREEAIDTK